MLVEHATFPSGVSPLWRKQGRRGSYQEFSPRVNYTLAIMQVSIVCLLEVIILGFDWCLVVEAGALKQWVDNQHKYDNYFCVVDLHAITNNHDKNRLRRESIEAAAMYIAAGKELLFEGASA